MKMLYVFLIVPFLTGCVLKTSVHASSDILPPSVTMGIVEALDGVVNIPLSKAYSSPGDSFENSIQIHFEEDGSSEAAIGRTYRKK